LYEQHFEQEFKKWKQQQKQLKQLKHSGLTAKKALEKTQKQQKAKDEKLLGKKARVLSMASLRHFFCSNMY
jgi:alanyl-tRNA synthetase